MTKRRVIIHGGLHKTGTTSLQEQLFTNREKLLSNGIFVYAHDQVHKGKKHEIPKAYREGGQSLLLQQQKDEFKVSGCHTLVIPSEGFRDSCGLNSQHFSRS